MVVVPTHGGDAYSIASATISISVFQATAGHLYFFRSGRSTGIETEHQ